MTRRAWIDGWRRVSSAPAIVAGMFALTVLLALPLALTLRDMLEVHLDSSLAAATAADGVNWDWWQEFTAQTSGLGSTFQPQIIGFAATLRDASNVVDGVREITPVAGVLALYLVTWLLLSGGAIDRYARQRPVRAYGFFAAAGMFFFRFLRLAVIAGVVYGVIFIYVHPLLFARWYPAATHEVDSERAAFAWRLLMYAILGLLLGAANLLFDYAKVRIVVEDRRSAAGAVVAAFRFLALRPGRTIGLYLLNSVTFLVLVAIWAAIAPGAGHGGMRVWIAFAITQLYIAARLSLKLHFLASQTALFQASLAHAAYTAAPLDAWPDSPAAEMIASR